MTALPDPLTPADCNLRDFQFMPMDVARLLTSETWILGTGDERAAAMTLWLESWRQVPAGSVPIDDRMLAHLSQSKAWKKVRTHALRGWIEASDGRLYHPVVAEKVLEAWVEKLAFSLSGSAGNAKRWGIEIETAGIRERVIAACDMLRALAPESKTLKKKSVLIITTPSPPDKKVSPRESPPDDPNASPPDRKGYVVRDKLEGISLKEEDNDDSAVPDREDLPKASPLPPREEPAPSENPAVLLTVALRKLGVNATFTHPAVQDWTAKGVSLELLTQAVATARESKGDVKIPPGYLVPIVNDLLNPPAASGAPAPRPPGPPRKPTGMDPKGLDESYEAYNARISAAEAARRKGQP